MRETSAEKETRTSMNHSENHDTAAPRGGTGRPCDNGPNLREEGSQPEEGSAAAPENGRG